MSKEALFNFTPERLLKKQTKTAQRKSHTATVNTKYGMLFFSSAYVRDNNAKNKFIKFYADPVKKAIAWKINNDSSLKELKEFRQLKGYTTGTSESFTIGITSLLKSMGIKDTKTFKKLEIKKYDSKSIYQDTLHYIELK